MTETDTDDLSPARAEQKRMGAALRRLRESRGLTQAQAGERFDVSTQAWQRYEAGERRFTEHKSRGLAEAIGATYEELMLERQRLETPGVIGLGDRGRTFASPHAPRPGLINELAALLGPHADRMRLNSTALSPWAESGELIVFDRERPPRRDQGCVVEFEDGHQEVWIFAGRDEAGVKVRSLSPAVEKTLSPVRGVFAVRFRGD